MNLFKNILYVNEPRVEQSIALQRAVSLAEMNQARLTIMEVMPHIRGENPENRRASQMERLDSLVAPYRQRLEIGIGVLEGKVFLEVIRAVLGNRHDLVIKPAENPDYLKQVFGSEDMHLLRKCPCPLWLIKLPEKEKYDRVMAAVDFNPYKPDAEEKELNINILEMAASIAASDNAALHLVHAWEAYAETTMKVYGDAPDSQIATHVDKQYRLHHKELFRLWETAKEGMESPAPSSPDFHLPRGPAKRTIARFAEELQADLIIMGTIGRTGISGLFIGNTAEAILNQVSCSVLAVKPSTFKTPVKLNS